MTILNTEDSLLVIIDIQEKLLNAAYNRTEIQNKAGILAKTAKILDIPCLITEQYPKGLGNTISEILNNVSQNMTGFEKIQFNALNEQGILSAIEKSNRKQIILAGIETHICVRQTAFALVQKGFDVTVVKDCCGSRSEIEHLAGLDIMKQEGCFIKTTEMVLFELLKSAKHPNFKEIQSMIK